jgi:hypothetical protein
LRDEKQIESNDYVLISSLKHDELDWKKASINLTVTNAVKSRDEGKYKCVVVDYYNNSNSAIAEITFVSEPTVTMTTISDIIELDKGKKKATFLIDYKAYPPASFRVYSPMNEQISSDKDVMDRYKYDVVIDEERLKFSVKMPDINDFGNYTVVATTAGHNFTMSLRLVVSGENLWEPAGGQLNLGAYLGVEACRSSIFRTSSF